MRLKKILLSTSFLVLAQANAFAPTNFFPPYDPALRLPTAPEGNPLRVGINIEYGDTDECRNWDGNEKNILQIHNDDESTIASLISPSTSLAANADYLNLIGLLRVAGGAWRPGGVGGSGGFDDGERGHVRLHGDFDQVDITPHVRYVLPFKCIPGHLGIAAMLPIRHADVHNITFTDLTGGSITGQKPAQDVVVQTLMTNDLKGFAKTYGNLDLGNWEETGLGDLVLMLDWSKDFPQNKDFLQNIELHAKLGVSCPTGEEKDEDKAFSIAFGNDGAWSLPFGIGLDLDLKSHVAIGAEAEFNVIFDESKDYRMKTFLQQTEFLLLNKGRATKDHGLTWKFYLYLQGYHFWRGLSLKAAYEYVKHDSDHLTPKNNNFNSTIVNTAHSLGEWYSHSLIFSMNYDFFKECKKVFVKPQMSFFVKVPVGGKKIIDPLTVGGQLGFNF